MRSLSLSIQSKLFLLVRNKGMIEPKKLQETLAKTFENRGTTLSTLQFDTVGLKSLQQLWKAHFNGLGDAAQELGLPENIEAVIDEINQGIASQSSFK